MSKTLYLINPKAEGGSYFGAEVVEREGFAGAQGIADLATVTVAAMAPPDWDVSVCDEYVSSVDLDHPAEIIGLTGKVTQAARILELAKEFRLRNKIVVVGGPFASLSPEVFQGRVDVLVTGELETIAAELFRDLENGQWKQRYIGAAADLSQSPLPRWDLYRTARALTGCAQVSRGCPFECEFCDVIQYLGRQQRTKPIQQVLAELDILYAHGFRSIFLADDNFTVYRKRAKEILAAIRQWNSERIDGLVLFTTQVSIDAARDPEVLRLMAHAGLSSVFIGLETPNKESLKEAKKRQNAGVDLIGQTRAFLAHGIAVTGGMMVGFDHDGPDIFEQQFAFAMESPVPIFSVGALTAPAATPLYTRLEAAGRLIPGGSEVAALPWDTNVIPARMSRNELLEGLRWLSTELYTPANFGQRLLQMIDALPEERPDRLPRTQCQNPRSIEREAAEIVDRLRLQGREERSMLGGVLQSVRQKPWSGSLVMQMLFRYTQVRYLYQTPGFAARFSVSSTSRMVKKLEATENCV